MGAKYDTAVNRESAYEILSRRAAEATSAPPVAFPPSGAPGRARVERGPVQRPAEGRGRGQMGDLLRGTKRRQGMVETMAKQAARTVGSQVGREILRGSLAERNPCC